MSVPPQPTETVTVLTSNTSPVVQGKTFTEDDIARVRKEEKDKLYAELSSYKDQLGQFQQTLADMQKKRDEEAAEVARIQEEKEAAIKAKQEAEMDAKTFSETRLKEINESWETKFQNLYEEREKERAFAEKERAYNELVDYRNSRLAELANDIAPQFHNFINGDNKEQIDAAIEQAKVATQSIFQQVQEAQQQPTPRGVSPTGYSAFGPLDNNLGQQTFTKDDINSMTMAEFAEFRQKSGMAGRDAARSRGLFS